MSNEQYKVTYHKSFRGLQRSPVCFIYPAGVMLSLKNKDMKHLNRLYKSLEYQKIREC